MALATAVSGGPGGGMIGRELRAKVVVVSLDAPLEPIEVGRGYLRVVLVVRRGRRVLGQVVLPALERLSPQVQADAIAERLAPRLGRDEIASLLRSAFGLERADSPAAAPSVSVVVCTRDRPDDLDRCLTSLAALEAAPLEVLVVDNAPADDRARLVCERHGVRRVVEPVPGQARARNRGIAEARAELIGFTDDDCVVDPGWLDDLGQELRDPLVQAFTGYIGPWELEHPAQLVFEVHGGFRRGFERRVLDGTRGNPAQLAGLAGAGANAIFRRDVFARVGLFAEELGPGTPARAADDNDMFCRILDAGYRVAFDPARVVWHRHRRDEESLRGIVLDYGISSSAFVTRRLAQGDASALRILAWWWLEHLPRDVAAAVARHPAALPLTMVLREAAGTLIGPWRLARSRRRSRAVAPIVVPELAPREPSSISVRAEWPSLAVVVPTRRGGEYLRPVLDALAAQAYPTERLEVVVAVDGDTPGPPGDDARAVPFRLSTVDALQGGVAAARNRGAEAASADVIVLLDDDTVPEFGCLAVHAEAHATGSRRVVLGYCPPVVGDGWLEALLRAWWEDHYRSKAEPAHRWTYADVTTGNSSLQRSLLEELGGFDEAFTTRHEDWELGVRLLERGVELSYEPAAVARHHLTASLEVAVAGQRVEAAADVLLARKHPRVAGQLPLGAFAGGLPFVDAEAIEDGLRGVRRLETLRLRTRWRRRLGRLLLDAYALGVREELRSERELGELLAAAPPVEVRVPLDGSAPPSLPAFGRLVVALEDEGRVLARVEPLQPGRQWNWEEALERIGREARGPLLSALARRTLREREPDAVPSGDRARA